MARSAGSEQRLRGGSGPRPNYGWCARALVIPGAQRSQCWPVGFGRTWRFGVDLLFQRRGGGTR